MAQKNVDNLYKHDFVYPMFLQNKTFYADSIAFNLQSHEKKDSNEKVINKKRKFVIASELPLANGYTPFVKDRSINNYVLNSDSQRPCLQQQTEILPKALKPLVLKRLQTRWRFKISFILMSIVTQKNAIALINTIKKALQSNRFLARLPLKPLVLKRLQTTKKDFTIAGGVAPAK